MQQPAPAPGMGFPLSPPSPLSAAAAPLPTPRRDARALFSVSAELSACPGRPSWGDPYAAPHPWVTFSLAQKGRETAHLSRAT